MTKYDLNLDPMLAKSNLKWLKDNTVYLVVHGSHAYGTSRPESDIDIRGVVIPPEKYYFGVLDKFEQAVFTEPYDCTIFDIRKFVELALKANPNVLELLFVDSEEHLLVSEKFRPIFDIREEFLSKKARFTFAGYSHAQLKRIKLHRRYITNPLTKKPERSDFGLPDNHKLIPEHQLLEIEAQIRKRLDEWQFDSTGLDNDVAIRVKNDFWDILKDLKVNHDDMHLYAARSLGLNDNLTEAFKKERQYKTAQTEWKQYQTWLKERNRERFEIEQKYHYDCYAEETEFLTKNGWKKYDDITESDLLATVDINQNPSNRIGESKFRPLLKVVYQNYIDRFEGLYTGNLYNLVGYHTDVMVTPNHRMLVKKVSRLKNQKDKVFDKLELLEISNLYDCFDIVRNITPNTKNYCVKEYFNDINIKRYDYLKLMGWYLSDGCLMFKRGRSAAINISQADDGKLTKLMYNFYNRYRDRINVGIYRYLRKPSTFRSYESYENVLSVREESIVNRLFKDCGNKKNKRIPRWIFNMSRRMMDVLLEALIGGDGTKSRPDNSMIYYSSLKGLADDVQELAFMCGYETSLYGPYRKEDKGNTVDMYHVHINKTRSQYKRFVRSAAIRIEPAQNKRIVCFTVPNSTLITRYNGHIGIHGNSKHGMHLVRLYLGCIEILRDHKLQVKRPDADFLLSIRNGAWSYDQLIEWAEKQDQLLDELYKTSTLRHEPNRNKINNTLIETIERFIFTS